MGCGFMSSLFLEISGWEIASHAHIPMKEALSAAALKFTAWHAACLPCDILTHLYASGLISNPIIARNDLECRWVEDSDWALRKSFRMPEDFAKDDCETLMRFRDIDCYAEIFLNGKSI